VIGQERVAVFFSLLAFTNIHFRSNNTSSSLMFSNSPNLRLPALAAAPCSVFKTLESFRLKSQHGGFHSTSLASEGRKINSSRRQKRGQPRRGER
jgi:hypothetical protein